MFQHLGSQNPVRPVVLYLLLAVGRFHQVIRALTTPRILSARLSAVQSWRHGAVDSTPARPGSILKPALRYDVQPDCPMGTLEDPGR